MTTRSILHLTATLGFIVFFATLDANFNQVFAQSCDTVTDQKLVTDIYARIKSDKALALQISHINVVVINKVVKLQGWTNTQKDFDKVVDIVSTTACVRMLNKNMLLSSPPSESDSMRSSGGCTSGTKACGDICIPEGDSCNAGTARP